MTAASSQRCYDVSCLGLSHIVVRSLCCGVEEAGDPDTERRAGEPSSLIFSSTKQKNWGKKKGIKLERKTASWTHSEINKSVSRGNIWSTEKYGTDVQTETHEGTNGSIWRRRRRNWERTKSRADEVTSHRWESRRADGELIGWRDGRWKELEDDQRHTGRQHKAGIYKINCYITADK